MAKLYVVNCTGQNREIYYRLDYTIDDTGRRISERLVPYRKQTIPARQQVQFGSDWHAVQIQEIIGQLEKTCGAVHVDMVRTAKKMGVVKLIWQLDKPISYPILKDVVDHNAHLLSDQGAARRAQLALAADTNLASILGQEPTKMEMEFEQFEEDPDLPGKLAEGIRVKRDSSPAPAPKKAPRARRAA